MPYVRACPECRDGGRARGGLGTHPETVDTEAGYGIMGWLLAILLGSALRF